MSETLSTTTGNIDRAIEHDVYQMPTSFAQRDMWLACQMAPDGSAYHIVQALALDGPLRTDVLVRSLNDLVRRHETLRTTFAVEAGELLQRVSPTGRHDLPIVNLEDVAPERHDEELRAISRRDASTPMNLAAGPLVRWTLARLAPDRHVLLYMLHHLVTDGWSLNVFGRELATLYGAHVEGQASPLPELEIQYGDFASWQRETLQRERLEALLEHWATVLAKRPADLLLPVDRHVERATGRCAHQFFTVAPDVAERLSKASRAAGVTGHVMYAAAFIALLQRLTGSNDLIVGAPIVNRDRPELEPLIGLFLNTLLLRIRVAAGDRFTDLLQRTRDALYTARDHADVPLELLASRLRAREPENTSSLVRVLFNFETVRDGQTWQGADVVFTPYPVGTEAAKLDLICNVYETESGARGFFEYKTDLFSSHTMARMAARMGAVLDSISRRPEARLGELTVLPDDEAAELLAASTASPLAPSRTTVIDLFEAQAQRAEDTIAVSDGDRQHTFGALDRAANGLARRLRAMGVGSEVRVAIVMPPSAEFVAAVLAVLKAGGAYVPIDPATPLKRIRYVFEDANVRCALVRRESTSLVEEATSIILGIDDDWETWTDDDDGSTRLRDDDASHRIDLDRLAYVMYTSGSTGLPKGVMVTHGELANYLRAAQQLHAPLDGMGAPLHGSMGADMSVTSVFLPLLAGQRITIVAADGGLEALAAALAPRRDYSFVKLTPSHLELLSATLSAEALRSARTLIVGAEALSFEHLDVWRRHAPSARIVNEYGPTEAVVGCCAYEVGVSDPNVGAVAIGRPMPGSRVYVLDAALRLVPAGVEGEVYIGGAQVARGYLQRPGLTAERYLPDPFASEPGARMYRTGDRARHRPDLSLEYLGRIDHQVKIRGFRVEPGEVEAALLRHPGVRRAAVIARDEGGGRLQLAAYIVTAEPIDEAEVTRFLSATLPAYMVPSAIVLLEALPLTTTGKVDRAALQATTSPWTASDRHVVTPRDSLEEVLASIWCKVLNVERIGVHDNFYALGGDSIRSLSLVALAKTRGLSLSLQAVGRHPTIATMASHLRSGMTAEDAPIETSPFSLISAEDRAKLPDDIVDAYPLAHMQLSMLFHRERLPAAPLFHSINSYYVHLPFDQANMQRAVEYVAARHPNVRTSFDLSSYSEALQLVHRDPVFPVGFYDLRHLSGRAQEHTLDAFWKSELQRPFDLCVAPQLRFHIHRRTDEVFAFTLTENHAVVDGWSLHLMYDEILSAYDAFRHGREPGLAPLRTTFRDFVAAERHMLRSPTAATFWDTKLRDYQPARLPRLPGHVPDLTQRRVKRVDRWLSGKLRRRLERLAREEAVPLKSVLLAAHVKVMSVITGARDIVTGLSSNGRLETADGERVSGLFLNTLPFRTDCRSGSWRDLIRRISASELELLPVRRYPIAAIQARWGQEAIFETSFVYLNFHVLGQRMKDAVKGGAFVEETNFAIMTAFVHRPGTARVALSVSADRWVLTDEQIDEFVEYYLATLEAIGAHPDAWHDAFSPATSAQRDARLRLGCGDASATPVPAGLPLVFERHAARQPDRPCLLDGTVSLSYAEVEARANRLAHYLRGLGVSTESRVAIGIDRSIDAVIGILAAMKAGACYVPLDPANPAERLAFIVRDADVSVVLTVERWRQRFAEVGAAVIALDSSLPTTATQPHTSSASEWQESNLAYIIYTSGTSGRPKGVAVEHRQLIEYLSAASARLELPLGGRYGVISTCAADLGHTTLFGALYAGGSLRIFDEREAKDGAVLANALARSPVDCLKIVPSHFEALLSATNVSALMPALTLVFGGEAVQAPLIERLRRDAPTCRLFNHYGPTETAVGALAGPITEAWGGARKPPLGPPLAHAVVRVLDEHMQLVPDGSGGELYIGGAGVARGYWNNPALTAERFVPDPFSIIDGARMYRTGDRVRWLPGGHLEFIGRIDGQIKVSGHRVEPKEVETVLLEHPHVTAAFVMLRERGSDAQLAAYVMAAPGVELGTAVLREHLTAKLPQHAVPSLIAIVPVLPLTANGKIDASALAEMPQATSTSVDHVEPSTPVERELAAIWRDVLNVERVGIHDNFFDVGGNSIKAILLAARARKAFAAAVSVDTVLAAGTIAAMAAAIDQVRDARSDESTPIARIDRSGRLPLSFAQQRFWYACQFHPETTSANVPISVRLRGRVNVRALARSLQDLVTKHEVLRAVFPSVDGEPTQRIVAAPDAGLRVEITDPTIEPDGERALHELARHEAWRPFDIETGPLIRALLIERDADDHGLVIALHHLVCDGWSIGILLRDLAERYRAHLDGEPGEVIVPTLQYVDFAAWQRARLAGGAAGRELEYWKTTLESATTVELPTDFSRAAFVSDHGSAERLELSDALTAAVHTCSREEGVTPFMCLLACYAVLLHARTQAEDIVIGCPIANHRDRPELQEMVGPCLNTLALRIDLRGKPSFRELLHRVRRTALQAYAHQDVPFQQIVDALPERRSARGESLFNVWFHHSDLAPSLALDLPGLTASSLAVGDSGVKFDLMLATELSGTRIHASLRYRLELFQRERVLGLLHDFAALTEIVVDSPALRLDAVVTRCAAWAAARRDRNGVLDASNAGPYLGATKRRAVPIHSAGV